MTNIKRLFIDYDGWYRDWVIITGGIFAILLIICVLVSLIIIPVYYSSYREAIIYNNINGTHYTASDFFWASDQINSSTHTIRVK